MTSTVRVKADLIVLGLFTVEINCKCVLFQDLGIKDTQRERVFLVNQIVRIGHMDIKEVDVKKDTTSLRRPFGVAGTVKRK